MFKLSDNSINNLDGVNPIIYKIVTRALQITKIDFGIPRDGGLRTAKRQRELYAAGKTTLDGVTKKSHHQSGNAFDVFAYVDGRASWDEYHLTHVAVAIMQAAAELGQPLEWGGFWSDFVDMPHFQLDRKL